MTRHESSDRVSIARDWYLVLLMRTWRDLLELAYNGGCNSPKPESPMAKRTSARHQVRTQDRTQSASDRPKSAIPHSQPAEKLLFAQYATTKVLAESATLAEAASGILQAICESLGWEFGALWTIDRNARALRCTDTWHTPTVEFTEFESLSKRSTFSQGVGLPGRVWADAKPAWIPDVVQDANFPRASTAAERRIARRLWVSHPASW